ncbi:MAG: hypothetical protein ACK4PI_14910, partial [Tepidisphaerales bacterium]
LGIGRGDGGTLTVQPVQALPPLPGLLVQGALLGRQHANGLLDLVHALALLDQTRLCLALCTLQRGQALRQLLQPRGQHLGLLGGADLLLVQRHQRLGGGLGAGELGSGGSDIGQDPGGLRQPLGAELRVLEGRRELEG